MFLKINTMSVVTNRRNNAYIIENYFLFSKPHITIIRPVMSPFLVSSTDEVIFESLSYMLNQGLYDLVRTNTNIAWDRINGKVFYHLYCTIPGSDMSVITNAQENTSREGPILTRPNYYSIGSVTVKKLTDIIDHKINQSARSYSIKELEWHVLFNPNTLNVGAGQAKIPDWFKSKGKDTWSDRYYNGEKLNCAVYAISRCMDKTEKERSWDYNAYQLQLKLNFPFYSSINDLKNFVNYFPDWRLTCIYPRYNLQKERTWEGELYKQMSKEEKLKHHIYIVYDEKQNHYAAVFHPIALFKSINYNSYKFCEWCVMAYFSVSCDCEVELEQPVERVTKRKKPPKICDLCGILGDHDCPKRSCIDCNAVLDNYTFHRCILKSSATTSKFNTGGLVGKNGSVQGLYVYDLEARVEIKRTEKEYISSFGVEDGKFNGVTIYEKNIHHQEPNLIVVRDVFTDEELVFKGDNCIEEMFSIIKKRNNGRNIFIAHNGAAYDTRLVYDKLVKSRLLNKSEVIFKGAKIMELKYGRNRFLDSRLHVQGSLRNLAKEYGYTNIRKGHFPHLFNSVENYNYKGPIPSKEYFDLEFMINNEKELEEFNNWYDSWEGLEWDFDKELLDYCKDDVNILKAVVKGYHENTMRLTGLSPWFKITAPSFVYGYVLKTVREQLGLPLKPTIEQIEDNAKDKFWAVLQPSEYYFARSALRGGRTDIRNIYHVVSDEDWNRGVRIRYQDICSQYPYQQVEHDFPVGTPIINIWDLNYYPCINCHNTFKCFCQVKEDYFGVKLNLVKRTDELDISFIKSKAFFGIVCVTVKAPKDLFHPVFVTMDYERNKCIASLKDEDLKEIICTTVELQAAVDKGYEIIKIHRYDAYTRKPSLWKNIVLDFFVEKLINAGNVPENIDSLCDSYNTKYPGTGDKIRKAVNEGRFLNNPGLKQTAKIILNSMWGKHAQRIDQVETLLIDYNKSQEKVDTLFTNLQTGVYILKAADFIGDDIVQYQFVKGLDTPRNFSKGYVPAAVFVPAYGRLQLWEQLDKLGDRVLMNDTDSIVYIYDPLKYNIPEGEMLGEWEVEGVDRKNGGIRKFVGLGPKTYGIKCENGVTQIKAKGLSLKLSHSELVNFEVMEKIAVDYITENKLCTIKVPQFTFKWDCREGMRTIKMMKDFDFKPDEMKGVLVGTILYPFGHNICDTN